jgi:hypothetical protein
MTRRYRWLLPLALFLLNLWIAGRLLTVEYLDQMGSIEGSRIALSRWMLENWRDLSWFPLWYGGIPFHNTYPPLCHAITAALAGLTGFTPALAYHVVIAILYALGPVALFWLALRFSGSRVYSFAAALFYSLVSPVAFLIPAVARDLGSVWRPRRLQCLILYGEGPHVVALTLLPVALLLVIVAWEKHRPGWWLLAVLGVSSVMLTNWLGAVEFGLAVGAWLLATPGKSWWKQWLWTIVVVVCAYAISIFWIPPETVLAFAGSSEFRAGGYTLMNWRILALLAAAILGLVCMLWLFRRFAVPAHARFAILFASPALLVTLSAISAEPQVMPHRMRFQLLVEMGIALLFGLAVKAVFDRFSQRARAILACLLLALCAYPAARYASYARKLIRPVDINTTVEYQEAKWLESRLPGERVFVPGSVSFFLNAFTDVPQFAGGFDPGSINPLFAAVHYQVLSGQNAGAREGEVAVLWLKAFGVGAVAVGGPRSREYYKTFRNPRKFDGLLPEVWRDGDDAIYSVPRRSSSLAHVMRVADLPARQPVHGLDVEPVQPYVAALENPSYPLAEMRWHNRHSAVISSRMEKDQIVSVQLTYHPGWRATVNGQPRRVYGDQLGQLVIEPQCQGSCIVEIHYNGLIEMLLAPQLHL